VKRVTLGILALASAIQLSCSDAGPVAGEVAINFDSPSADDWAVRFTVIASSPQTLQGLSATCSGCQAFVRMVSDSVLRAIVYGGPLPTSELARLSVSDTRALTAYKVTLLEVAGGDLGIYSPATRGLSLSVSR